MEFSKKPGVRQAFRPCAARAQRQGKDSRCIRLAFEDHPASSDLLLPVHSTMSFQTPALRGDAWDRRPILRSEDHESWVEIGQHSPGASLLLLKPTLANFLLPPFSTASPLFVPRPNIAGNLADRMSSIEYAFARNYRECKNIKRRRIFRINSRRIKLLRCHIGTPALAIPEFLKGIRKSKIGEKDVEVHAMTFFWHAFF